MEKVNPMHPDKVADVIAGMIVDKAYSLDDNPRIAAEVLIGHGNAYIIAETSVAIRQDDIYSIVCEASGGQIDHKRGIGRVVYIEHPQDPILANNQDGKMRAGDNGIFKGVPTSPLVRELSDMGRDIYNEYSTDGKYILTEDKIIVCQSNAESEDVRNLLVERGYVKGRDVTINPLGDWTGGLDVDTGATNRKLGSDMGEAVTGGGLHGKDLSKADVSLNIYAHIKAQETGKEVNLQCAIGDTHVNGVAYEEIVEVARKYIKDIGGFRGLAEWGLV